MDPEREPLLVETNLPTRICRDLFLLLKAKHDNTCFEHVLEVCSPPSQTIAPLALTCPFWNWDAEQQGFIAREVHYRCVLFGTAWQQEWLHVAW